MNVEVLMGPPGCGKSTKLRDDAVKNPGLYLFAAPSLALIEEQATAFRAADPRLHVVEAHYKSAGKGSVEEKLEAAREQIARLGLRRAVILTTHETLMACDLSAFAGWHFRIDEAPNAVQSNEHSIRSPHTRTMLRQMFDLVPATHGWSEVRPTYERHRWREVAEDVALSNLSEFIKHASRRTGAFVDISEWRGDKFGWCAAWTPALLDPFAASVQIAGASYLTSVGALVAERFGGVSFLPRHIPVVRSAFPAVRIHYFTEGHEGASTFWAGHFGRGFIVKLCDFLVVNEPNLGFWSGNDEVQVLLDHRVHGGPIPPKVAGLNQYRDLTSCAFIYSAKPKLQDAPVKALFEISDDEIRHGREDEDILQFVMRGALRKPDYDGDYDIYLYSRSQAERLAEQLRAAGMCRVVTLVPEAAAGFMHATRATTAAGPSPAPTQPIIGASGKVIKPKSKRRADLRAAEKAGKPPAKRGRKPKPKDV